MSDQLTDAERERFAQFLREPEQRDAVAAVLRSEARRDPRWLGGLLAEALNLGTLTTRDTKAGH
jgi:hypothetical protein